MKAFIHSPTTSRPPVTSSLTRERAWGTRRTELTRNARSTTTRSPRSYILQEDDRINKMNINDVQKILNTKKMGEQLFNQKTTIQAVKIITKQKKHTNFFKK
jgi:hypothetical protein